MTNKESAIISQEVDNDGNVNDSTVSTEGLKDWTSAKIVGYEVAAWKNNKGEWINIYKQENATNKPWIVASNKLPIHDPKGGDGYPDKKSAIAAAKKLMSLSKESVSTEKLDVGDSVSTRAGDGKVLQVAGDSIMVQLSPNSDYPGQVFEYSRTDLQKESVSKESKAFKVMEIETNIEKKYGPAGGPEKHKAEFIKLVKSKIQFVKPNDISVLKKHNYHTAAKLLTNAGLVQESVSKEDFVDDWSQGSLTREFNRVAKKLFNKSMDKLTDEQKDKVYTYKESVSTVDTSNKFIKFFKADMAQWDGKLYKIKFYDRDTAAKAYSLAKKQKYNIDSLGKYDDDTWGFDLKESVSKEATAQRLSDPNLTFYTVENYVRQNGGKAVTNINLNKALNQILMRDKIVEKPTKQWYKKLIQIMNEEGYTNLWFDWPTANRTLFGK